MWCLLKKKKKKKSTFNIAFQQLVGLGQVKLMQPFDGLAWIMQQLLSLEPRKIARMWKWGQVMWLGLIALRLLSSRTIGRAPMKVVDWVAN